MSLSSKFPTDSVVLQDSAVVALARGLQPYLPAGQTVSTRDGHAVRSLGWIILSHLDTRSRACILAEQRLWVNDIWTFPSWLAISTIARRADYLGDLIDFDRVFATFSSTRSSAVTSASSSHGDLCQVLHRAGVLYSGTSRLCFDVGVSSFLISLFRTSAFTDLHTVRLYVASSTSFQSFVLPCLRILQLYGSRDVRTRPTLAWRSSPVILSSALKGIFAGTRLERLELEGLDVKADAARVITDAAIRDVQMKLRKPSSVAAVLDCYPENRPFSRHVIYSRPSFTEPLPGWVWRSASMYPDLPLAVVFEGSLTMAWITILPMGDWPDAAAPYFQEGADSAEYYPPKLHQPTLIVRYHRISRLYLPNHGTSYLDAMVADLQSYCLPVDVFIARELRFTSDGQTPWLRRSRHCGLALRAMPNIYRLVIEDERLADIILDAPPSCTRADFVCRSDWYGRSGVLDALSAAREHRTTSLWLRGASRQCDQHVVQHLSHSVPHFVDARRPTHFHAASSLLQMELETAQEIVRYHEMKDMTIRFEMTLTY
ncbi:unnamed protein product [Peniophora sp. CBMAI 1063]|nr:unnamed protein product [Peniophora sp. CBMAI 1063]